MAIMVALAGSISKEPVKRGNVALLFQPAEESGMGARSVMADSVFKKIKPDFVYAMHNLPGFSQHRIILSDGGFSAASLGLKVILKGLLAHAAEPDKGINPASAISQIITEMGLLQMDHSRSGGQVLITPAHIKLGDPSFGLSPGKATLHLTLRAMHDDGLSALKEAVTGKIREISCQHALLTEFSQHEIFPASVNHIQATDMLIRVAEKLELSNEKITNPFLWSEDFAWYTREIPGAMFGIGSGVDHTNLHNPNYDFPDEILETGVKMFYGIARELLG
jgi:amidohydrolase